MLERARAEDWPALTGVASELAARAIGIALEQGSSPGIGAEEGLVEGAQLLVGRPGGAPREGGVGEEEAQVVRR